MLLQPQPLDSPRGRSVIDRRHLRRDADDARHGSPAKTRAPQDRPTTDSVLELQHRAGNQAVASLLGTRPGEAAPIAVQLESSSGRATPKPTDKDAPPPGNSMSIPALKLTVPILAFTHRRSTRQPRRGEERLKPDTSGQSVVTLDLQHLDPRVYRDAAAGTTFDTITVKVGTMTFTLRDVIISAVESGEDHATITLDFGSSEVHPGPQPESGTGEGWPG